jgi:PKD repeat protein
MSIAVRSTSTLTFVGFQDSTATPGPMITMPAGLTTGDYLVIGVFFAQDLGDSTVVVPSGFTQLTANGTSSNRMFVTYGLAITNSTILSSVASGVYLRASGTATRIVAIAAALTGVSAFSSSAVLTYSNTAATGVTYNQPGSGDALFYFVVTNSSSPSTSPAHTSVGGTKIVQAVSPSASSGSISDSQMSLMQGGTGATFAASVANYGSVGFGLTQSSSNAAPSASFTNSVTGMVVSVDGTASSDSDGTIASYDWNWGDGTTHGTGSTSSHTYSAGGTYTLQLTVTDNGSATGSTSSSITIVAAGASRPAIVGTPTTAVQTTTTAKSITISKPSGVTNGDYLIAALRAQDGSATTDWALSGWTRIGPAFVANSAAARLGGFYAKYIPTASAETATSYTFTWTGGGGRATGIMFRVQGGNTTTLVDAYNTAYASNTITNGARLTSYSVPDANGLQLAFAANEQTSPNASESVSVTAGYNFVASSFSSTGTGASRTTIELYQKSMDAGSTTQMDVTWAAVSSSNIQSVVIKALPGSNIAPTAGFTTALSSYTLSVTSTATDSDGTIASYDYNWGDSTSHATTANASHTYTSTGTYTVTQTVVDNGGATSTYTASISVPAGASPVPHFGTGNSTSITSASTASIAISKPANTVDGDLLVAYIYGQNTGATVTTVPAGWTFASGFSTRPGGGVYTKPIPSASSESATSYTWAISASGGRMFGDIFRVTGADLTNPIDVAGTGGAEDVGTAYTDASVTTNYTNSLLVGFNFWNNSSTTVATASAPAGMTAGDQLSTPTTTNTSGGLIAYQALTAQGATGSRIFSYSPAATNVGGLLFAIKKTTLNPVASYTSSSAGTVLSVNGSASAGVGSATISSYDWNWGDGTTHGTSATMTHTYAARGTYTVILTVTDNGGLTGALSKSIVITDDGYAGVWRDGVGTNHPGVLYYWDGTAKHPLSTTLVNTFNPVTVTQFLSSAHSPWFSAHRGFSYSYPEETLYGYQGTVDWGMKAIEVSAQVSADGTWWCFHDPTVDRTTGISGTIASMTDAQIGALNNLGSTATGNPGQPSRPTAKFVDVVNKYYKTHVIIVEDKTYTHTTAMLNLLDSYGTSGRPASEIFIWKVASSSSKATYFDPAAARGYHRWAYIFDNSMSTEFPALASAGKADMIGMDFNSSDATLSSAIALCVANGVMPTGHIITNTTQRDRLLGLGMKGLMMANKSAIPPWYNIWTGSYPTTTVYNFPSSLGLTPGTLTDDAGNGLSLGLLITCKVSGLKATGMRWYAGQTQTVTPYLWDAGTGTVLATGASTYCGVGWNTIPFTTPFSLVSGNDYIVGTYQDTQKYTASSPTWPQSTTQFGISSATMSTGYYSYSTTPGLSETSGSTNQWYGIDIVATS